jgi:lipopolysaccharide export system permease protein
MMIIAFAALGNAQTTRQGRGLAIASAVVAVVLLRILGFAASSAVVRTPAAVVGVYALPLGTIVICLLLILQGSAAQAARSRIRALGRALLPSRPPMPQKA